MHSVAAVAPAGSSDYELLASRYNGRIGNGSVVDGALNASVLYDVDVKVVDCLKAYVVALGLSENIGLDISLAVYAEGYIFCPVEATSIEMPIRVSP